MASAMWHRSAAKEKEVEEGGERAAERRMASASPSTRSTEVSPTTTPITHDYEDSGNTSAMGARSNGYMSSPLRSAQRSSSITDKALPDVPQDEIRRPSTAKSQLRFGSFTDGSFPFAAQPGTTGPAPTTADLTNGSSIFKSTPQDALPSPTQPTRNRADDTGTGTPTERRSVQFAREPGRDEPTQLQRTTTWEAEEEDILETHQKDRQASFLGKLKALAAPGSSLHMRNFSSTTASATPNAAFSPQSERSEPTYPVEPSEAADADVEEESQDDDEPSGLRYKKRRKSKRPAASGVDSSPSTPKTSRFESRFASFIRNEPAAGGSTPARPAGMRRQDTMSDAGGDSDRAGLSEGEGRDRIRNAWRRGIEGARGLSYSARRQNEGEAGTEEGPRRPSHLRRLTGIGNALDGQPSSSPFRKTDRQTSTSAQKWRQVKAGLKMLGQRKRDERMRVDHQKSAQLMAELLAGAPAALVFASMFQRDEHGHRKIPVLLEQLKLAIPNSDIRSDKKGDRHLIFKIDLEYGNGPAKINWTIQRSLKDFVNLHAKYQAQGAADKVRHLRSENKSKAKMPKFPKTAFPYARTIRGLFDNLQEEDEDEEIVEHTPGSISGTPAVLSPINPTHENTIPENTTAEGTPRTKHKRRKSSFAPIQPRRTSTSDLGQPPSDPNELTARQRDMYAVRQRRKLETYLQQMIRWLIFRADSTRLCKFLELSALALRLSVEGGFQGKQGLLTIASRRNGELRRKPLSPQSIIDRHKPRWFLVRHSYIVCVDGPESLLPFDVFLVDSDFTTEKRRKGITVQHSAGDVEKAATESTSHGKHLILRLYNSERKLKLLARTERQYLQFMESIDLMKQATVWSKKQRFASYAPVRNNVWCQWLVDGRDHMWQVSRAIDLAKDFVYIHDWWLSPELYMRRPAAISQKWRLDRLLQRKARQGVKIFVIVYRNIESAIPIDSEYTKWSLLDLHPNICIQRSPNQFRQNQFFWAHHEKLVVVDNMAAFVGGVDLCFGRWDDPCHTLTDDKLTGFEPDFKGPRTTDNCQVWPGKDYSNPRVQDFYALDRPYEEMYDRTKVPRMPWHDISMQIVGQPARDVGRHFVQRWNYILRSRVPSRPTPVLLPPPEYEQTELDYLGMTGTCQVQILRSCAPWSIGTPNKVEHSIMNAYVHLIEHSDHFVYIENQFFVSSCTVEGTTIHNKIGDALVERAIRAYDNGEQWAACIVIPLMPGFQNSVDSQDGTSIRLIMQCQFRSICRGETSIFERLRKHGIDPEEYVRFYSLRQWGKIGPRKCLTTEQLYIHAKCMVVDDRHVIIGSANINERSMLGSRDSEVAALVTDMRMIPSSMGGEPYEVGEFPHTLRKRLMREHLGVDVDNIYRREYHASERAEQDAEMDRIYRDDMADEHTGQEENLETPPVPPAPVPLAERNLESNLTRDLSSGFGESSHVGTSASLDHQEHNQEKAKKGSAEVRHDLDVDGYGTDNMRALEESGDVGLTDSFVDARGREVLLKEDGLDVRRVRSIDEDVSRRSLSRDRREEKSSLRPPWPMDRLDSYKLGLATRSQLPELPALDDTDIGGPPLARGMSNASAKAINPLLNSLRRPEVHEDCMTDPLVSTFYRNIWHLVAENNTKLYRQVFRCMPDNEVIDWKTYEKFNDYSERFMQSQGLGYSKPQSSHEAPETSGPPGSVATEATSSEAMEKTETRQRSKSVLSGVVERLRQKSKTSIEQTHMEEVNEKPPRSPDSPQSEAPSSGPTVVPSPPPDPADEKEAHKASDQQQMEEKHAPKDMEDEGSVTRQKTVQYSDQVHSASETTATQSVPTGLQHSASQRRRKRATTKGSARQPVEEVLGRDEAESLLKLVQGHLVLWPYDWLEKEERNGNWLYNIDQLAPLEIYD